MTDFDSVIWAVEHGLLKPEKEKEDPVEKMGLIERMAHYKVPGISVALVNEGEVVWAKGYGVMEVGMDRAVTADTIFQAGSISKPVTGLVALHLVEAGVLDLDVDVNDVLQSWKVPESKHTRVRRNGEYPVVTLRGLLSHSAGVNLRGYRGYLSDRPLPTLQQILLGEKPPANSLPVQVTQKPGKGFKYSGGGYLIAQQLIEDVTGRPLADLAQELIFDKLGMASSTFTCPLPQIFVPRAATAHNRAGKQVPGKWHIYKEQAAGGLWSTPSDLARVLVEVIKSNRNESNLIISQEMTQQLLTAQKGIGGLGFLITYEDGKPRFGHNGWTEGYHSLLIGNPDNEQGYVWMTNGENGAKLGSELTRGLIEAFGWTWY
jgi:CubicO group peptidase (beta-lactamase class C family)